MINFSVTPLSMISKDNMQLLRLDYECEKTCRLNLSFNLKNEISLPEKNIVFDSGIGVAHVSMPVRETETEAIAVLSDNNGKIVAKSSFLWIVPLKRTIHIMVSSHTDIGLHNSQYIQRKNSVIFLDDAARICDETDSADENNKYRYTVEGTWWWNNYCDVKGEKAARELVENYINKGKINVCAGIAGNHIQTYGLEEMCRSTYERSALKEKWNIDSRTLAMIDNNGLPMSMIQPYCNAGYKNIIFSPNQWNPLPSKIWHCDTSQYGYPWNTNASGGGSRIDFRYSSNNPLLFFWEDESKNRLLVWGSCQYGHGGSMFGLYGERTSPVQEIKNAMSKLLPTLDKKYPYDSWLVVCYSDDQVPNTALLNSVRNWNKEWAFPKLKLLGDIDCLFDHMREKYGDIIPVVKGDFTGGWYQHPLSAAELLAEKFAADRLLSDAEKLSTIASLVDGSYKFPSTEFERAWKALMLNDEHSYGTSGYQGRRVYETWIQHRDWIEKAANTAKSQLKNAVEYLASNIASDEEKTVVFNLSNSARQELIETADGYKIINIPSLGYSAISKAELQKDEKTFQKTTTPPIIENDFYKVEFAENGAIPGIYDKKLEKQLVDTNNAFRVNELVYTNDNHNTFFTPERAEFEIIRSKAKTTVVVKTTLDALRAELEQKITILNYEKRIDIENRILHAKDMINSNRYYRYLYFAFPFMVNDAKRLCRLNGCVAEYGKDVSGYCTDVYMATNEWCCSENKEYGVALVMHDSQLMEFDHIHPEKTDFGNTGGGSQMFSYIANDWLQMHAVGGSHLNYLFRYSIISYKGTYESENIPKKAELILYPVIKTDIGRQSGIFKKSSDSFVGIDTELRMLILKPAENGNGVIGHFFGKNVPINKALIFEKEYTAEINTLDEHQCGGTCSDGFIAYRFGKDEIRINKKEIPEHIGNNNEPAPIGMTYTGLITKPRAARGENHGHLYLLWGANTEADLSHYKLYRSETPNFVADDSTFLADVYPEDFCVGRYVDENLKYHTIYFYRVCAVNKNGVCGKLSEEFSAYTKE